MEKSPGGKSDEKLLEPFLYILFYLGTEYNKNDLYFLVPFWIFSNFRIVRFFPITRWLNSKQIKSWYRDSYFQSCSFYRTGGRWFPSPETDTAWWCRLVSVCDYGAWHQDPLYFCLAALISSGWLKRLGLLSSPSIHSETLLLLGKAIFLPSRTVEIFPKLHTIPGMFISQAKLFPSNPPQSCLVKCVILVLEKGWKDCAQDQVVSELSWKSQHWRCGSGQGQESARESAFSIADSKNTESAITQNITQISRQKTDFLICILRVSYCGA